MKNDSKSCSIAQVDVTLARPSYGKNFGITFTNEIDIWAQIEFRACHQIRHMRQSGRHKVWGAAPSTHDLVYSTAVRLED